MPSMPRIAPRCAATCPAYGKRGIQTVSQPANLHKPLKVVLQISIQNVAWPGVVKVGRQEEWVHKFTDWNDGELI